MSGVSENAGDRSHAAPPRLSRFAGISNAGWPLIAPALGATLLLGGWGGVSIGLPLALLSGLVLWFFRDPTRIPEADEKAILSPADGRVVGVRKGVWSGPFAGEATRISIFLSVFNVHINRLPYGGRVRSVTYTPGRFLAAFSEKASLDNEQTAVTLDTPRGVPLAFVQIAGLIARRIVCRLQPGETVVRGERYGLIRFGSRVDVYLPPPIEVQVKVGEKVRGGESVLGVFP